MHTAAARQLPFDALASLQVKSQGQKDALLAQLSAIDVAHVNELFQETMAAAEGA